MSPPIDSAEFDAHKDLGTIITQFLFRNKHMGFSAAEISRSTGISEQDVNNAMVKLGLSDIVGRISGTRRGKKFKIEDVTVNGIIYYRCADVK